MPSEDRHPQSKVQAASEIQERRRQSRGLLYIALIVLIFSLARTGLRHSFPPYWWHFW